MKTLIVLIILSAYRTPVSICTNEDQNVVKESFFCFPTPESFLIINWPKHEYGQTALIVVLRKKSFFAKFPLFRIFQDMGSTFWFSREGAKR